MELLVPWLEVECLRDLAEESSCESDCECESDLVKSISVYLFQIQTDTMYLEWSDSDEAACLKKSRLPVPLVWGSGASLALPPVVLLRTGRYSVRPSGDSGNGGVEGLNFASWICAAKSEISRRASRYLEVTDERSASVAVWVSCRATS